MGDWFIYGVAALQSGAVVSYLWAGDWKQALVWGGVVVSNLAYLALERQ